MRIDSPAEKPPHPHAPCAPGFLVIEPDDLVREALVAVLGRQGFRVWQVANLEDGREVFRRHATEIDLLMLELRPRWAVQMAPLLGWVAAPVSTEGRWQAPRHDTVAAELLRRTETVHPAPGRSWAFGQRDEVRNEAADLKEAITHLKCACAPNAPGCRHQSCSCIVP